MITRYNISKPRKYTAKNGEENTYWDKVGEMVEFENGNRVIKIPAIGLEASVFLDTPKKAAQEPAATATPDEVVTGDINPEDIPF